MDERTGLRHFEICPLHQAEIIAEVAALNLDTHEPIKWHKPVAKARVKNDYNLL